MEVGLFVAVGVLWTATLKLHRQHYLVRVALASLVPVPLSVSVSVSVSVPLPLCALMLPPPSPPNAPAAPQHLAASNEPLDVPITSAVAAAIGDLRFARVRWLH